MNTSKSMLETPRLWLRPLSLQDVPSYTEHFVDYEVIRQLSALVPWPYPEGGVEDFLRTTVLPAQGKDRWTWGLFSKSEPTRCIGSVELWREGKPEHRGFWLSREHWGRGLMTEAATAVTDYAFDTLGFELLVFSNALGNTRSRRIKEKTGARLVRVEPAQFVDPQLTQREIWELTRTEWAMLRDNH